MKLLTLARWLLCVAILLVVVEPDRACADDATLGARGSGVVPLQNDEVEMLAERVDIRLYHSWAHVEATFTLRNAGSAVDLLVGFPQESQEDEMPGREVEDLALKNFTASVDGVPVPTTYRVGLPSPTLREMDIAGWHTFNVSFAEGQTRQVKNTYLIRPVRYSNSQSLFTYLLRTGALWKGAIGQAEIIVYPSGGITVDNLELRRGSFSQGSSPRPSTDHVIENGDVVWRLRSFEPSFEDDVSILVSPPADRAVLYIDGWRARPGDSLRFAANARGGTAAWPAGGRWVLYAGESRVELERVEMASSDAQIFGVLTIPASFSTYAGRAIEVWAEHQPSGMRSLSTLLLMEGEPQALPPAGELPSLLLHLAFASLLTGLGLTWVARRLAAGSRP